MIKLACGVVSLEGVSGWMDEEGGSKQASKLRIGKCSAEQIDVIKRWSKLSSRQGEARVDIRRKQNHSQPAK